MIPKTQVKLKIQNAVYDKFVQFIKQFNKDEIEIISENDDFVSAKQYLQNELDEIVSEKAIFYSFNETENKLEQIINKNHFCPINY